MRRVIEMTADVVYRAPGQDDVVSGTIHVPGGLQVKDGLRMKITISGRDSVEYIYHNGVFIPAEEYTAMQLERWAVRETRRRFAEWSRRPTWEIKR